MAVFHVTKFPPIPALLQGKVQAELLQGASATSRRDTFGGEDEGNAASATATSHATRKCLHYKISGRVLTALMCAIHNTSLAYSGQCITRLPSRSMSGVVAMTEATILAAGGSEAASPAPIQGSLHAGLALLWRAHAYAQDAGVDTWDFAVEIGYLYATGVTISDLRWLVAKGLVLHARETTVPGEGHRSFQRGGGFTFAETTCFVLTPPGAVLARTALQPSRDAPQPNESAGAAGPEPAGPTSPKPHWVATRASSRGGGGSSSDSGCPPPNPRDDPFRVRGRRLAGADRRSAADPRRHRPAHATPRRHQPPQPLPGLSPASLPRQRQRHRRLVEMLPAPMPSRAPPSRGD